MRITSWPGFSYCDFGDMVGVEALDKIGDMVFFSVWFVGDSSHNDRKGHHRNRRYSKYMINYDCSYK